MIIYTSRAAKDYSSSKSESIPVDPNVKMSNFIAEINMFGASFKKRVLSLLLIYLFMTLQGEMFLRNLLFKLYLLSNSNKPK